jgi:hypothetical protein
MKFNHKKTRFGHHKTFPLRYSWLTQDFMAVKRTPTLFSQPEQAMITLGSDGTWSTRFNTGCGPTKPQ